MNNIDSNNTQVNSPASPSGVPSVWTARKDEHVLASADSEKSAWRLLGARGKKQIELLKSVGFEVRAA